MENKNELPEKKEETTNIENNAESNINIINTNDKEAINPLPETQKELENIINNHIISLGSKKENINENINPINNNLNNQREIEKTKRHRRTKNETIERNFRCPECDRCYLSGPALMTHRKHKHNYGNEGEKRAKGRPRKNESIMEHNMNQQNKFNAFFSDQRRKPLPVEERENEEITIEKIKKFMIKIYEEEKDIFKDNKEIEKYDFYNLLIDNWDKDNPFPEPQCYSAIATKKGEPSNKISSFNIDELLFLYLKECSQLTNEQYFWFLIKFIVLLREGINIINEKNVKEEDKTEKNKYYTQIYNGETIAEFCNDIFIDILEPNNFFGLDKIELIELIQHFCYWLYSKKYAQIYITSLTED